jgi:hypothetical protein
MLDRASAEAAAVLDADGTARVHRALSAALAHRQAVIDDDHDPRTLLPARTIRILVADAGCRSADALAAAAFVDSVEPHLAPDAALLDEAAARLRAAVPLPAAADAPDVGMLERLVTAEPECAIVAIAERLDQARHLHQRANGSWAAFHAGIRADYVPAARRLAPMLARRLERWADAFERRLLLRG